MVLVLALLSITVAAAAAPLPTTTSLGVSSPSGAGSPITAGTIVTLTATVTAAGAPAAPGLVIFCDATATRCTDAAAYATVPLIHSGPLAGTATLRMAFGAGNHSVKALLAPTRSYQSSTSNLVSFSVTDIPTKTTLQTTGGSGTSGLNVTVAGAQKSTVGPTGTVSLADITNGNTFLGSAPLGPSIAGQSFVQGTSMAFAESIENIVTGDFNGDGRQDLALAMVGSTVLIALGNGDGTFQTPVPWIVNGVAYGMATGDFNQDGALDLVVTDFDGTHVDILFNNGDGTFNNGVLVSTGVDPIYVSVGDFNEDGIPDLAVSNDNGFKGESTVSILLGNGDGNFTPAAAVPDGSVAPSLSSVADFNGDGHLDIFLSNGFYGYTVLLGNGDGTFSSRTFLPPPGTYTDYGMVVAGDFNSDGIPDVVIEDSNNYLIMFLGNGDGTFTQQSPTIPVGNTPHGLYSSDLNGDGKLDLVVPDGSYGGPGENELLLFYGNGDGTFTQATIPDPPSNVAELGIADFNGDGLPDILVGNAGLLAQPKSITADIFLDQFSQTATASLSAVCVPGTGTHQVQATYPGDANYQSSTSAVTSLTASPVATSVALTSAPASVVYGSSATLTAGVSAATGVPTGAVTFFNGGVPIGSATLDGTGHASLTTTALALGAHAITASYGGTCPWSASTSAVLTVQVAKAALSVSVANATRSYGTVNPVFTGTISGLVGQDTVTVTYATTATASSPAGTYPITASVGGADAATYAVAVTSGTLTINKAASSLALAVGPNPALARSSISFTAQAMSSTTGAPTGTVTFSEGSTVLGTATLNASRQASYSTANLSVGVHSVTASYNGDQNFLGGVSSAASETVGDYTLTTTGAASQTVSAGAPATYTFAVLPTTPTLLAPVTLAVTGLPAAAEFSFSPSTVATGSGATTVNLTVTPSTQMGAVRSIKRPTRSLAMAAWLLVLPWGVLWHPRKRLHRFPRLGLCVMASGALLCLCQLSGCGGHNPTGPTSPTSPTPGAQTYNVTVTASSGTLQHSTTVELTVQ